MYATNPLETVDAWKKADEPFMFIAACILTRYRAFLFTCLLVSTERAMASNI